MNKGAFSLYIAFREWEQQGKTTTPIFPTQAARNRLDPLVERCFGTFPPTKKGRGLELQGGKSSQTDPPLASRRSGRKRLIGSPKTKWRKIKFPEGGRFFVKSQVSMSCFPLFLFSIYARQLNRGKSKSLTPPLPPNKRRR